MSQAFPQFLPRFDSDLIRFAPFAILILGDQGVVEIANTEALRLLANSSDLTEIVGAEAASVFPGVDLSAVGQDSLARFTTKGASGPLELQCVRTEHDGDWKTIVYLSPVGGRRQRELLLEKEASTDHLSGLPNRRALQRTLETNLHRGLSLAIVDIDQFKSINDDYGHPAGDSVIQLVADLLSSCFSDNAVLVSRMGGDEFGVLFETVDSDLIVESLDEFREGVDSSVLSEHPDVNLSVSVGVAISNQPLAHTRILLTAADGQLLKAKRDGRNRVCSILLHE